MNVAKLVNVAEALSRIQVGNPEPGFWQDSRSGGLLADMLMTLGREAREALAAPLESWWLTIDSAPKDGTVFIVAMDRGRPQWAWFHDNKLLTDGPFPAFYATHWQPLPAPPTTEKP